ncbi:MAG TPA: flagellar biosynthesis protein FlhB [Lachnospiraceae bacterium]|nr:flagellar biosynthesis protein FlhB [Lachnospiraceae bacterium]
MAADNEAGKKKIKTAVAIEYDPGDAAPRVVASGRGAVAERIIKEAQDNDVAIHKDGKLADTLSKLEIGDYIPPELYEVVAEILVFVDDMERAKGKASKIRPLM